MKLSDFALRRPVTVFVITIFISIIDLILNKAIDFLMRMG